MAGSGKTKSNMHRVEFSRELARRTGMSVADAESAVEAFLAIIRDNWTEQRSVCFDGFGVFDIRPTSERMARNPRSMEDALIPAGYKPVFRVSKGLRQSVNQKIQERCSSEQQDEPE